MERNPGPERSPAGGEPDEQAEVVGGDFVVIKALEDGVTVMGLTRGPTTRFHHIEKLDRGEVMIAQFTRHTAAIKVRGRAQIWTRHGQLVSGETG
ncbi:MAG TPA: trp RNA-binding attenuation protein MtrB [Limnochordales bacterium]